MFRAEFAVGLLFYQRVLNQRRAKLRDLTHYYFLESTKHSPSFIGNPGILLNWVLDVNEGIPLFVLFLSFDHYLTTFCPLIVPNLP